MNWKVLTHFFTNTQLEFVILETLVKDNAELKRQVLELKEQLAKYKRSLQDAVNRISASNKKKEGIEKAICRQLTKTHEVLRKARGNLESNDDQINRKRKPRTVEKVKTNKE